MSVDTAFSNDVSLEAGTPVKGNTFDEYGIQTVPVITGDGKDTGRRFIFKDGNFLTDVSSRYNLLPNERALEVADSIAEDLGAEPFDQFDGDWYCELDEHAITDDEGRRLHAMYSWSEDTVEGDEMNYGFIVHNSIDATLGFSVGLFSFRHACSNMVWMGAGQQASGMSFDDRELLQNYYHRHTEGLETDKTELKALIRETVGVIPNIHDTYEEWTKTSVTVDEIKVLRDRLPHDDLPEWTQDAIDLLKEKREGLDEGETVDEDEIDQKLADAMPSDESTWETYNEITENVWHSDTTNDRSKDGKMDEIHRVMSPAQGIR
jgi:hypothetical protein